MVANFVELPVETQLGVIAVVVSLFDLLVVWLLAKVPWLTPFVEKYREEWANGVALAALLWVQNALPTEYPDASIAGVNFVLALLLIFGLGKKLLRDRGVKGFRE